MNKFDKQAAVWDDNPVRLERAKAVAEQIRKSIPNMQQMRGLEYGCGTGTLSFELRPFLNSIVLADNSKGMLEVLENKISKSGYSNMKPKYLDLTETGLVDSFDIIYALMSIHHIVDVDKLIKSFYDLINKSGYLCIADLVEEDGSFHGEGFTGHNGFSKELLTGIMERLGFEVLCWEICYNNIKKLEDGTEKVFPLFLAIARKAG